MSFSDPRLLDPTLLRLAARRRLHRQAREDWEEVRGISALLEAAKRLPPRDPDAPIDESTGLGKLLAEARRQHAARGATS